MLKSWSLEFKQLVYDNIISSWTKKEIPEWWKWTNLTLKPKDLDNITPDTLRPLVLVEVLRKVWIGLIINQTNAIWHRHNILNPSQHGFRPKRGTDTAILQLQSIFEQSAENQSTLYLSSWDVKKAFDSLSKNTLRFGWTRLGVPEDIAKMLVSLDEQGHTIIRTPYSQKRWKKLRHKGFITLSEFFSGERGAGQGDVGSPLNWVAAYDILLCALSTVTTDNFYVKRSNNTLVPAIDIAYADDLISAMSTAAGLQLKADIVSAFSIIFGLDIATVKLRTFCHFPTGHIPTNFKQQHIHIHTSGWKQHTINIATKGTLKVLGKTYDISSKKIDTTQYKITLQRTTYGANMVRRARGSRHQRKMVLRSCVSKRAEYAGQFSSWSQAQLDQLDVPINIAYRQLTSNTIGYPTEALYLSPTMGGLGLHRISDGINTAKYSMVQRHLLNTGNILDNIHTLINNASNSTQHTHLSLIHI